MFKNSFHLLLAIITVFSFSPIKAQEITDSTNQDIELGKVSWYRDYDEAVACAEEKNKPILILFQEVPGCATCKNYGSDVLSHPLMVEAIEELFIPLVIHNNKKGKDAIVLQQFREPSWNNPVVRIVNTNGSDIIPRVANNYSAIGLYNAMADALEITNRTMPTYMKLLGEELTGLRTGNVKDKYFKMYCFWTGEKHLGSAEGVLNTEAGFMNGHEVVKVTYDKNAIKEDVLETFAQSEHMLPIAKDASYRPATNDEDYFLKHTAYKYLPLSQLQRTKINSAIGNRLPAEKYLSPKQVQWLEALQNTNADIQKEVRYNKPFASSWEALALGK